MRNEEQHSTVDQPVLAENISDLPVEAGAIDAAATSDGIIEAIDQPHQLLDRLLAAHEAWFDITRDYEYAGRCFDGYGEFRSHGESYVLSKKATLWEIDAFEYLFFAIVDELSTDQVQDLVDFITTEGLKKVVPDKNHMKSYLSLCIIANSVDEEAAKLVRKSSFSKSFRFGLRGWVDMRLAAVDLSARKVMTNGLGKQMREIIEVNAGWAQPKKKRFRRR